MKPFGGLHLSGEIFGDTGLRENVAWHMHPERCPPSIRSAPNAANEVTLFIRQTFIMALRQSPSPSRGSVLIPPDVRGDA
jgi:hypothetical protein